MNSYSTLDIMIEEWEMTETQAVTETAVTDDVGSGQGIKDAPQSEGTQLMPVAAAAVAMIAVVACVVAALLKKKTAKES